jgi:hypothetical protein
MSEQLSLLEDRPIVATLEVFITRQGKDRGGPGVSIALRMSEKAWQHLLDAEREQHMTAEELVRWAMIYREV